MKTALLILAFHTMLSAQTPSLADVARQERARQKTAKSDTTITNETLGTAVGASEPAEANKAAAGAGTAATPAAAQSATDAVRDETWWRDAFKKARAEVQRSEDRSRVLQLELNQLNMDLLTRSDIYNREGVLGPQIMAKNTELAIAEKAADQARQNVTKLEDDLRRSGAPAGWAR